MYSPTAEKLREYAKLCAKYLHSCVRMAATSGRGLPCFMVSPSSTSWSPRRNTTASTMIRMTPMNRFFTLNFMQKPLLFALRAHRAQGLII